MQEFIQQLGNGLTVGGIYALIALGYTMVYGVLRLINFAHGDLFTLGAYLGLTALVPLTLESGKFSLDSLAVIAGLTLALAFFIARPARFPRLFAPLKPAGANPDSKVLRLKSSAQLGGVFGPLSVAVLVALVSIAILMLLFKADLISSLGAINAILVSAISCIGLVAVVGYLLERVAYRPLRRSDRLAAVVSALGASIFFQNAMMLAYGPNPVVYPGSILPARTIDLFGFNLPILQIGVCGVSFLLMCILYWFIHKTRTGTAIRAAALDQDVARLMGVDVNKVIAWIFMIGAGLGAAAGLMVGLYYGKITHDMGLVYGLKAFTAAILGGIGNIPGAMLGGVLLGVIETLGAAYISIAWKDAIAFMVLIAILIFRPTGILGERMADRQ